MLKFFVQLFMVHALCCAGNVCAQDNPHDALPDRAFSWPLHFRVQKSDSVNYIQQVFFVTCKSSIQRKLFSTFADATLGDRSSKATVEPIVASHQKPRFLSISGDVYYEFFYRSRTDTPFQQTDIRQHTERVNLKLIFNERIPINLVFNSRQSNSPFFRNFIDPSFRFDATAFRENIRKGLEESIRNRLPETKLLKEAESILEKKKMELAMMQRWLKNPATLQRIIEERERMYFQRLDSLRNTKNPGLMKQAHLIKDSMAIVVDSTLNIHQQRFNSHIDSLKNEVLSKEGHLLPLINKDTFLNKVKIESSLPDSMITEFNKKQRAFNEKEVEIKRLERSVDSLRNVVQYAALRLRQKIRTGNADSLRKIAAAHGISADSVKGLKSMLAKFQTLAMGRNVVNYTELTVSNLVVTGIHTEYSGKLYTAFAAGKIDYRFRDFFNKKAGNNNQFLVLGRLGVGNVNKRMMIFSLYRGRKNQSEFNFSDTVKNYIDILGYSLEFTLKKNEHSYISAEFAKSTKPVLQGFSTSDKSLSPLLKFTDQSNMGFHLKGQTLITKTATRLSAFFRKTGDQFQCFSVFNYLTDQTSWQARVDQPLFKNRASITAMLRRNDFVNPFTERAFKSSTVFKSFVLGVRVPKYPYLSVGYYPGSQFFYINNDRVREDIYYILNGSLTYTYKWRQFNMNSVVMYNKYTSKATDSGFNQNNGYSFFASQTIFLKKFQVQAGASFNKQPEIRFSTIEASLDFQPSIRFKVGAAVKLNEVVQGSTYIGTRYLIGFDIPVVGMLQLHYDKSYLPSLHQNLYPVESGRIVWNKKF